MPTIRYSATGDASPSQMDAVEFKAREWQNGTDKILYSIEKRFDSGAVAVDMEWKVSPGDVDAAMQTADDVLSKFDGGLPLATSGAATVEYTD